MTSNPFTILKVCIKATVLGVYKLARLDSPFASTEYGLNWSKQRRKCLKRDGYACRVCGDSKAEIGQEPSVHHITPRSAFDGTPREMNALENLVSLCPSCHHAYEGKYTDCVAEEFVQRARHDNR